MTFGAFMSVIRSPINKWINQLFKSEIIKKQIYSNLGATINQITVKDFKRFKIPLPPLEEQKAITEVLSTWDTALESLRQLIEQKKLRKKWLMQQLLTGKKRLPGFTREWEKIKIGKIIKESKIKAKGFHPEKRLSVKLNLKGIEEREIRGTEAQDATYFFKRKAGQFIYGKQNLYKGAFGIIPKKFDGYESSQDIPAFDFINKSVLPKFFLYYFSLPDFYKSLEKYSTGTGSKRIHPKELYKVKISLPSLKEQQAIAEVLQTQDKEIELLEQKLSLWEEQKKGLMQVLLTGKKRIKNIKS